MTSEWQEESAIFQRVRAHRACEEKEMRTHLAMLAAERYAESAQFAGYRGVHWRRAAQNKRAA
jgi:hypothetical protein